MQRAYTQKEFYELVWSKPMTKLAKEFGISDVALHKMCRRHIIPTPPLGYWAKVAHSKPVSQTPFPAGKDDTTIVVRVREAAPDEPKEVKELRARAKERAEADAPPESENKFVTRTLAKLRMAKPDERGIVTPGKQVLINCQVAPTSVERLGLILDHLVIAARKQRFELVQREDSVGWTSETAFLSFDVSEEVKRSQHVQTPEEAAAEERWTQKVQRQRSDWSSHFFDRPQEPKWDYNPTGKLTIQFEAVYVWGGVAPRRLFRDGRSQSLDEMADEIAIGMVVLAQAKLDEQFRCEERARLAEVERQKRIERDRLRYVENRRTKAFDGLLEPWIKLERSRELLAHLRSLPEPRPPRVTQLIAWAEEEVTFQSSRFASTLLDAHLTSENVFGDTDDRGFYPNQW